MALVGSYELHMMIIGGTQSPGAAADAPIARPAPGQERNLLPASDYDRVYLYCLTQSLATRSIVTVDGGAAVA